MTAKPVTFGYRGRAVAFLPLETLAAAERCGSVTARVDFMSWGSTKGEGGNRAAEGADADSEHVSADPEFELLLRKLAAVGPELQRPPLPEPGTLIDGKYCIEICLGRGGMGAVFRARHEISHKPVAIKWMLRSPADEQARKRLVREARAAARIDHPNVVDVYDIIQDGESCCLVMELLHGESLRKRLERGQLPVQEAIDLLIPAMRGVGAVHRAGVLHRDLKPDNIFLCESPCGVAREAKVLDFGISAVTSSPHGDSTLTENGALLGTPAYMSPEQLQSARDIDVTSDVYAFGVILYEALTGTLPFNAESYPGLVLAIIQHPPKGLRELCPALPVELERIVLRALAKRREDRFPDMESFIAAVLPFASAPAQLLENVRAVTTGTQLMAAPVGTPVRSRWSVLALLALSTVVAASWAWSTSQHAPERRDVMALHGSSARPTNSAPPSTIAALDSNVPVDSKALALLDAADGGKASEVTESSVASPGTQVSAPGDPSASPSSATSGEGSSRGVGVSDQSSPPHRTKRAPKPKPAGCDPPYWIDSAGHTQFKLECL